MNIEMARKFVNNVPDDSNIFEIHTAFSVLNNSNLREDILLADKLYKNFPHVNNLEEFGIIFN